MVKFNLEKALSGFVNIYRDNNQASYYAIHENKEQADMAALEHRIAVGIKIM